MTSLYSATVSPVKDSSSSPLYRPSNLSKPPLRALYDLLIAPMEGVCMQVCYVFFSRLHSFALLFDHVGLAQPAGPDAQ